MVKYLLASHGKFAEGTKSFLDIMISQRDDVYTLGAFMDERGLDELIEEKMKEIGDFEQLIVFCDLNGGSVAQKMYIYQNNDSRDIKVIAGYNIALVMDIIFKNKALTDEEIRESINECKNHIVYLNDIKAALIEEDLF